MREARKEDARYWRGSRRGNKEDHDATGIQHTALSSWYTLSSFVLLLYSTCSLYNFSDLSSVIQINTTKLVSTHHG